MIVKLACGFSSCAFPILRENCCALAAGQTRQRQSAGQMSRESQPSFRANANEPFGLETITSDGFCSTASLCCCRWICRVCCCNSTLNLIDCNYKSIPHLDFTTKALCEIVVKQIGVSQHCDGVDCLRLELLDAGRTLQGRHCLNQKVNIDSRIIMAIRKMLLWVFIYRDIIM